VEIRAATPSSEAGSSLVGNDSEFCGHCISFILRRVLQHTVKSHDMEPTALLPLRKKSCYWFILSLKIHGPRPGLNPRIFGPVASTITTRPPRTICDACNRFIIIL
jgi:hypothetical protein